jgi:multisubunit Na+/H+ antiporter MnhB subunit
MNELVLAFDVGLAVSAVAVAWFSVVARDTFAAIVAFVAYGLLLSLAWMRLSAPDVALTEAAIGSGLTGVLLLGVAAQLRPGEAALDLERPGAIVRSVAALACCAVAALLALWVVTGVTGPAPTLAPQALAELDRTGVENPITAVLMAYRATDTMLEKIVLLLATIGVWSLTPDLKWGGRSGPRQTVDPDGVLVFLARVLPPFGVVIGVYILWVSSKEPGGAFQGGTILAAMWLLIMLAGLMDAPATRRRRVTLALLAGPVVFVAVGFAGCFIADAFLAYPVDYAKALILLIEFPMLLSVAAMLGLLVLGTPQRSAPR